MSCAVKGCCNVRRFKPKGITFHRFPRGDMFTNWVESIGLGHEFKWTENKFVCSSHFKATDFVTAGRQIRLKPDAVPNLEVRLTSNINAPSTSFVGTRVETLHTVHKNVSFTSSSDDTAERSQLKRTLGELSSSQDTSASTDSSTKRKRIKFIQTEHSYSTSPRTIKKKYSELKRRQLKVRKKVYSAKKTIKSLKRRITTLKTIVSQLKQERSLSDNAIQHLEKCYEDVPHILMSRYLKNVTQGTVTRESYPEKLRNFACTLHFYSGKAYEYVRNTFSLALPHQSVIRKWYSNIHCHPGFCDPSFDALKLKVAEAKQLNRNVICSLMLDEMAIKKQIEFDGKRTWGYIDVGVTIDSDDLEPASEALVLMIVCHNSHWKLPIAYFFIKSLNGVERANIVREALIRLAEIEVDITSVTCDGPSVHFSMLKELGCALDDVHHMQTWFPHPSDTNKKIYCLLDVCHMLKLLRNLFASFGQIKTPEGIVDWNFIKKLYAVQEEETLKLAHKLKKSHIEWEKQKMKVSLAAQTLSGTVANALEFLNSELQHPDFVGVEATALFIKKIDNLFDLLNSRSPYGRGYKAPLREDNKENWKPFLLEMCQFLIQCTDVSGRPLYCTPKKTAIFGFVISAISVMGIFNSFVQTEKLNYLLTYKCSQDHLEIFFSSVRARNGWNNNPSCLQFMRTFRKLLLFSKISGRGGNCKVLDDTVVLNVPSTSAMNSQKEIDISLCRKYSLDVAEEATLDHDYHLLPIFVDLNEFSANVVTYISGYVVKMLKKTKTNKCPECVMACTSANDTIICNPAYRWLLKKNRGGLEIPSEGVVKICYATETAIRRLLRLTENKLPHEQDFMVLFVTSVVQQFYNCAEELFPSLIDHNMSFGLHHESHLLILMKSIASAYTRIRFFNLSKKYTEKIQGHLVRKQLTKLILFNHQ